MRPAQAAANRRGIIAITLASASFIANDALAKYVSESLPSAQLIFIRGFFAMALLLAVAQAMGLLRAAERPAPDLRALLLQRPMLWRAALDALGTMTYLSALFHLPIANATAISMANSVKYSGVAMLMAVALAMGR